MARTNDTPAWNQVIRDFGNTVIACGLLGVLICGLGYALGGKLIAEKSLTTLVQPLGALWLLLAGWTLQLLATSRLRQAIVPSLVWIALTLCSTAPMVDACNYYLEFTCIESTSGRPFDPARDEPLDALIVLGGGTNDGPYRAQAAQSGDRIVYAAELFQQGLARRLITTGDATATISGQEVRSASEITKEIWTKLGIPADSISSLSGRNTYEELQSVRALKRSELAGKRVGLLTSAMHLPRAMRLASAQGLDDLIPVAANYEYKGQSKSFYQYLPRAETLDRFARCQHELLAGLVSR